MEIQTLMRTLNVINQSMGSIINRIDIKNVLSELEKNVVNVQPDLIILAYCSRYVLSELNNKEWCKYYHMSVNGTGTSPRSHLVLSRYPILRSESFGSPLVHIVETKIAFNDIPIRYEYEDVAIQSVDMDTITVVVTSDSEQLSDQHVSDISNILAKICSSPHTVILAGASSKGQLRTASSITWSENVNTLPPSSVFPLCYVSEAWDLKGYTERTNLYEFELVCLE